MVASIYLVVIEVISSKTNIWRLYKWSELRQLVGCNTHDYNISIGMVDFDIPSGLLDLGKLDFDTEDFGRFLHGQILEQENLEGYIKLW